MNKQIHKRYCTPSSINSFDRGFIGRALEMSIIAKSLYMRQSLFLLAEASVLRATLSLNPRWYNFSSWASRQVTMSRRLSRYASWPKIMEVNCCRQESLLMRYSPLFISLHTFPELIVIDKLHNLGEYVNTAIHNDTRLSLISSLYYHGKS